MKKSNILISTISALCVLSCGKSPNVAGGVETGNGIVAGIVAASEGSVVVSLIPENFNPVDSILNKRNSDTTGVDGAYSVSVPAGTYNLYAASASDKNKIDFVSKVVVIKDSTISPELRLESAVSLKVKLDAPANNAGTIWAEGSLFTAPFALGDTVAIFPAVPSLQPDFKLFKTENGIQSLIASTTLMKGNDGFSAYTTLIYDSTMNRLWAGTTYSGAFHYNTEKPIEYIQFDTAMVNSFKSGIVQITNHGNAIYIVTNREVLKFDEKNSSPFTSIFSGSQMIDVKMVQNGTPAYITSDSITIGTATVKIPGILSATACKDTLFAGTVDGKIHRLFNGIENNFSVDQIGAVWHLETNGMGKLFAAGRKGLAVIQNGVILKNWGSFGSDSAMGVRAMSPTSSGSIFILTKTNQLFLIDSDLSMKEVVGFKNLIPLDQQTPQQPFPIISIAVDENDNLWLLTLEGALLRIEL